MLSADASDRIWPILALGEKVRQATMWSMPIVAMEPVEQFSGSLVRVLIGLGVGPFAKRGMKRSALPLVLGV